MNFIVFAAKIVFFWSRRLGSCLGQIPRYLFARCSRIGFLWFLFLWFLIVFGFDGNELLSDGMEIAIFILFFLLFFRLVKQFHCLYFFTIIIIIIAETVPFLKINEITF